MQCSDIFVIMGVSGCGKSTVGAQLAVALGLEFLEGDTLHSAANVARMANGVPLTDADRQGWLQTLADRIRAARLAGRGLVLSCSALKRAYRDILRQGASELHLVHLQGSYEVLAARMTTRTGHYMPLSLLVSQMDTLEVPGPQENAQVFSVTTRPELIVAAVISGLGSSASN